MDWAAIAILMFFSAWGGNGPSPILPTSRVHPAQENAKPATPPPTTKPQFILKEGTPVRLRFSRSVSSSKVIAGEKLDLEVVEEVRIGELVVVQKDSIAKAMVTMAQAKRAMARGGNMEIKIETVRLASGGNAPLRMVQEVKGGGHKAAMITGMVAVGAVYPGAATILLFVQGKDAAIPEGTEVTAFVNADVALDPATFPAAGTEPQAAGQEGVQQETKGPK